MRSADAVPSAFLWINSTSQESEIPESVEQVGLSTIRTHSKRIQRKRRHGQLISSAQKIAQEGFQTPQQPDSVSGKAKNAPSRGNKGTSSPRSSKPPLQVSLLPRHSSSHASRAAQLQVCDPGRNTDPFGVIPVSLDRDGRVILDFLLGYVDSTVSVERHLDARTEPSLSSDRWMDSIRSMVKLAFSSRVRMMTIISGNAIDLSRRFDTVSQAAAIRLIHQSLATTRESLRARQVTSEHFFATIMLFRAYRILGDNAAAVMHLRAAYQFWDFLGGPYMIDSGSLGFFCASTFGIPDIDYSALEPPIQPFCNLWTPRDDWPPRIIVDGKTSSASIMHRTEVAQLVDMVTSHAQRYLRTGFQSADAAFDLETELLNLALRQHLLCLISNDTRVSVFCIALHLLVFSLAGYSFFTFHKSFGAEYIKTGIKKTARQWKEDYLWQAACLVIGAHFSPDHWFIDELAVLAGENGLLKDCTVRAMLLASCGPLIASNLIPPETIKALSTSVEIILHEQGLQTLEITLPQR